MDSIAVGATNVTFPLLRQEMRLQKIALKRLLRANQNSNLPGYAISKAFCASSLTADLCKMLAVAPGHHYSYLNTPARVPEYCKALRGAPPQRAVLLYYTADWAARAKVP